MKVLGGMFILGLGCSFAMAAELPEISEQALADLGTTYGTPQMNGFVFIEGRYLPPPYTVTRKGNGLFINRVQFEQPFPWPRSQPAGAVAKKAVDADGDFQEVGAAAAKPAAAVKPAVPATPDVSDKPKTVKSIDDLFADDAPAAAPKPPADEVKPPADEVKPPADEVKPSADEVKPPAGGAPEPAPQPVVQQPAVLRSPEDIKRQKDEVRTALDNMRKGYEQALIQGEVFFFGQRNSRLNGNYGTARAMMQVLPSALRQSQSPADLMQRLNQGDIYFIDMGICTALFKNKMSFPLLEERLRKIEENEELDAARRSRIQQR